MMVLNLLVLGADITPIFTEQMSLYCFDSHFLIKYSNLKPIIEIHSSH